MAAINAAAHSRADVNAAAAAPNTANSTEPAMQRSSDITHVPVVGPISEHPHGHAVVVFDADTGRKIGHNPNYKVEQVSVEKSRGTITTTLKIRHIKDA